MALGKRMMRGASKGVLGFAGLVALYFMFALVLGLVPVNRGYVALPDAIPADGIEVFVVSNGVHAGFAVPLVSRVDDLRSDLPLPPGVGTGNDQDIYVMIGWGDQRFYTQTRTWGDLTLRNTVSALLGFNDTVVHVEHIARPRASEHDVPVRLSEAQYKRLLGHIGRFLRRDQKGRLIRLEGVSHGRRDAFYMALGRYTLIYTCNEWVREGLAAAGVRTSAWSPLDWAIFHHLRR